MVVWVGVLLLSLVDLLISIKVWQVGLLALWFLAIGAFEDSVGAGLACGLACGAHVLTSVVVTSTD